MPAIDTDALVALVTADHPHHAEAVRRFEDAVQVYVHPAVACEFTTVVRRQANRAGQDGNKAARRTLKALLAQPRVRLDAAVPHAAAAARYEASPRLSLADAIVAESRWHYDGQDPISFDQALLRAAHREHRPA